ncbi:MAG: tRNA (guanosine(46)-N7)-methyltransferase TrmB [Chloroflexi bacterium]|nr:tRNA (guanosine(46)-N7)-methyltransferase TrmB [Chloroflexota bacterium]
MGWANIDSMRRRYLSLEPFIPWRQSERPIDWRQRFGREAPLIVEIGFGNGAYLVQQALAHPDRDFVGIEMEWPSVQRGLRRIAQAGVSNVRIIQVDARVAFERLFTQRSVQHVYSLFPCPWRKEKHVKHRLFGHGFLRLLNSRLVDGGDVQVVTDYRPYVDWILEQVPDTGFGVRVEEVPPRFGTKYERKWSEQGQRRFYELSLSKQAHIDIPVKEDISLRTYRIDRFDPDRFQPAEARGEITVVFKSFLYDPKRQTGMVHVIAAEEGLTQSFWIEIVPREGAWVIRPAPGCGFVPTAAVQRALDLVYEAARGGE